VYYGAVSGDQKGNWCPMSWTFADLTTRAASPPAFSAAGNLFGYGVPDCSQSGFSGGCPIRIARVVYRGTDNNIYELALVEGQWRHANLLAVAQSDLSPGGRAYPALSDPTAFVAVRTDLNNEAIATVVYEGFDGYIYQLSLSSGGWAWDNISTLNMTKPATLAAGRPFGYATNDGYNRVVYRGIDNYIYELSAQSIFWACNNLSTNDKAEKPAPAAAGDPFGYITYGGVPGGVPRVIYRGTNGHIYELHPEPFWRCNDLSEISSAPPAAGDPFGYQTKDGIARVIYRDAEGQIIELALLERWTAASLSTNDKAAPPAPPAAGNPFGYVTNDGVPRVVYRGTNGDIFELHPEPFWRCNDLSQISSAPTAAGDPFGYFIGDDIPRVIYRNTNNHVCELALL
jgi:hypothetical protein